ncbi:MAG: endo-1,4-beta-xylanase [Bacteroidales bacterium]|nr:endo-1,4-beta-xylanase [Bacteroidales bacterium]
MRKPFFAMLVLLLAISCGRKETPPAGLKDAFGEDFLVGVALNEGQIRALDSATDSVIRLHFNAAEPENCLKSEAIHPEEDTYDWELADKYVDFCTERGITPYGHVLIWHSQLSPWFAVDENGNDVSPEVLKQRMKEHITTVMTRYKGRIKGWDVVNEAIEDDGSWRQSPFYRILGEEYIPLAFQYAHEADPDCELYYNDYGMHHEGRHRRVLELVGMLKDRGLRIDAVGFQGHMGMDYPDIAVFEKYMREVADLGVGICITEWDMSALPTITSSADVATLAQSLGIAPENMLNPYPDALPEEISAQWNKRVEDFFSMFRRNSDIIRRVNIWGLNDSSSWKSTPRRRDYPLLFNDDLTPKDVVKHFTISE